MIRFHNICNNLLFRRATLRMQLSQPAYLRYESGERTPSIHVIYYMAHILGTSADYLTGKSDDPTPNRHYIYEVEKPELFSLIEKVNNCDSDTQKRLLSYFQMISKQNESKFFCFWIFHSQYVPILDAFPYIHPHPCSFLQLL